MRRFVLPTLFAFITFPALARESPKIAAGPAPATSASEAEAPEAAANNREHRGFFLRTELGAGYRSLSFDLVDMQVSGAGVGTTLLLGGSPTPNLFVIGELSANLITNPTVRLGSESVKTDDASAMLIGVGPGIVYYLMPANVSLGASLLLSKATISQGETKLGETELGLGGSLRVGKEWWIGSRTGLGVNGNFNFASMKDKGGDSGSIFATSFTLSALFTYN